MLKHLSRPPSSLGGTGECLIIFTRIIERFIGRRDKCVLPVRACTERLSETYTHLVRFELPVMVESLRSLTWSVFDKFQQFRQVVSGLDQIKQRGF